MTEQMKMDAERNAELAKRLGKAWSKHDHQKDVWGWRCAMR